MSEISVAAVFERQLRCSSMWDSAERHPSVVVGWRKLGSCFLAVEDRRSRTGLLDFVSKLTLNNRGRAGSNLHLLNTRPFDSPLELVMASQLLLWAVVEQTQELVLGKCGRSSTPSWMRRNPLVADFDALLDDLGIKLESVSQRVERSLNLLNCRQWCCIDVLLVDGLNNKVEAAKDFDDGSAVMDKEL